MVQTKARVNRQGAKRAKAAEGKHRTFNLER
jgi:hypothetical protein